jgi:hypothetical protein
VATTAFFSRALGKASRAQQPHKTHRLISPPLWDGPPLGRPMARTSAASTPIGPQGGFVAQEAVCRAASPLRVVYCLLPIAYCPLPIAYCLLFIVYCILSIVYCLLSIVYCLLSIVYCRRLAVFSSSPSRACC